MNKKEIKKELINLYHSMSNEEKEHLDWEADGTLYIIDYAAENGKEELCDAFDELDEDTQDELLDEIADLYYDEFGDEE